MRINHSHTRQNQAFIIFGVLVFIIAYLMILFLSVVVNAESSDFGDTIPAISCSNGMEATLFADGLSGPDGLVFDNSGNLLVVEETAGRVIQIDSVGITTTIATGLNSPEGIAIDRNNHLYIVEDILSNARLLKKEAGQPLEMLANTLVNAEGVAIGEDGTIYVTASDVEQAAIDNPDPFDIVNYSTYLYSFAATSPYTQTTLVEVMPQVDSNLINQTASVDQPSFSGMDISADQKIYIASESSGVNETQMVPIIGLGIFDVSITSTHSIYEYDIQSSRFVTFIEGLKAPEGLRLFEGAFPLYAVEEGSLGVSSGTLVEIGSNGLATVTCTGFRGLEDVAIDADGAIYVSDDTLGRIIKLSMPITLTPTPSNTPTSTATPTLSPTSSATPTSTATVVPSLTPTLNQTSTPTEAPTTSVTPAMTSTPILDEFTFLSLIRED